MLVCILLILASWNGATGVMGTDDVCDTPSYRACPVPGEARHFPKTEEDIDQQCTFLPRHLECLKDYGDKCGYEDVHPTLSKVNYEALKNLLEDICRKDSQLHLRLVQNIGCLSEMFHITQFECTEKLLNKTAAIRQYIENQEAEGNYDKNTYDFELWAPFLCVSGALYADCFASETSERCGSDTRGLVVELVVRSGSMRDSCPSILSEDRIDELIRVLELELEEERLLKEIISK